MAGGSPTMITPRIHLSSLKLVDLWLDGVFPDPGMERFILSPHLSCGPGRVNRDVDGHTGGGDLFKT
jgi:hypothetical protein